MSAENGSCRTDGRWRLLAPLLAGGLLAAHLAYVWGWTIEDVFILFRWARNAAEGMGLVYNPGERVEGYSNFFYLLVLAGLHRMGVPAPDVSSLLGLASAAGVFLLLWVLLDRQPVSRAPVRTLGLFFLSLSGSFCLYAVSGLETVPYTLMLLGSLELFRRECFGRASLPVSWLVMVPAVLCRPEAPMILVAAGMSLGLWAWVLRGPAPSLAGRWLSFSSPGEREAWLRALTPSGAVNLRVPAVSLAITGAALAAYYVWKASYFGSLLPNTFYLKATGSPLLQWAFGLKYSLLFFFTQFNILAVLLLVPLVRLRDHLHLLPHLLILLGYAFFNVTCGGDWMPLYRFYVPVLPSAILLLAFTASRMAAAGGSRLGRGVTAAFVASLLLLAGFGVFGKVDGDYTLRDVMAQQRAQAHTRSFYELGNWMKANLPPDTTLASAEAGVIPYLTGFYYLDMKGYIDKHIAHMDCPVPIWCKFDNDYILSRKPDCIVLNLARGADGSASGLFPWGEDLLQKEAFRKEYRLLHEVERGIAPYRVSRLSLFCRHEVRAAGQDEERPEAPGGRRPAEGGLR